MKDRYLYTGIKKIIYKIKTGAEAALTGKKVLAALCLAAGLAGTGFSLDVYAEETVPVTEYGMTVDSFQGVDARYIPGLYNSNTGEYCCAGYVIKFYKTLYGVDTFNINTVWGKPTVVLPGHDVALVEVSEPEPGDMMQNLTYSHVGIVKKVEEDKVILIEQNYKWGENGQTVAAYEREIGLDEAHFYRLVIDGEEKTYVQEPENGGDVIKAIDIKVTPY